MTCAKCKYSSCVSIIDSQYQCNNGHKGIQQGTEECPDASPKDPTIIRKEDWVD